MTYDQSRYISIMKWRAKNIEKVNALNNSYKIKLGKEEISIRNKRYKEKVKYYSYELESKRFLKILL